MSPSGTGCQSWPRELRGRSPYRPCDTVLFRYASFADAAASRSNAAAIGAKERVLDALFGLEAAPRDLQVAGQADESTRAAIAISPIAPPTARFRLTTAAFPLVLRGTHPALSRRMHTNTHDTVLTATRRLFVASFAALGLFAAGCAGNSDGFHQAVAQRAAFDLGCSSAQTDVQPIGGSSYGASGCGKKASYSCICAYSVMGSCTQPVCTLDGAGRANPQAE